MFYTPRGLKIRLPVAYAFTLMARLSPRRSPTNVLRTVEGIEMIPNLVWEMTLLWALYMGFSWGAIVGIIVSFRLLAVLMLQMGLFFIPGLPTIALQYSYIPSILRWLVLPVVGYFARGWAGVGLWAVAFLLGFALQTGVEFLFTKVRHDKMGSGPVMTTSELYFFHAYRLHATSLDVTTDITISDEEADLSAWRTQALRYSGEYPQSLDPRTLVRS